MPKKKPARVEMVDFLPDDPLVRRVLAGEVALFEVLVHRYSQRLYRTARAILGDDEEAADVVQETWIRAYRKLSQFAGRARFSTWLTRIAVYEARARRRRSGRRGTVREISAAGEAARDPGDGVDPEKSVMIREMRAVLESAIEELPDHYRTVFVLRVVEEMSTAETAEVLGLTTDVVKTRLRRARALMGEKLRRLVGPLGPEAFAFAGERCRQMWKRKILPAITVLGSPRPAPRGRR